MTSYPRLLYAFMLSRLKGRNRDRLSKLVFDLGISPKIKKNLKSVSFPTNCNGGMIISADFEMAWAFRYSKRGVDPLRMAAMEREHVPIMVDLLDEYCIPISWATVGHLFLDSCKKSDHSWMRRIPYFDDHWKFVSGDWYDHDPYTDVKKNNAWYAPDLIEMILRAKEAHEFACHTFSHIDCTDIHCPPEVLDDELTACKDAAMKWGIELKSLVFPGGTAGNFDIVKKHGFRIYRMNLVYDLSFPYNDNLGMYITTSSGCFVRGADWSADYYVHRFKRMIDLAINTKTVAHFWLHPSVDRWTLDNVLPSVLRYAAQKRESGELWIGTMGGIADHMDRSGR